MIEETLELNTPETPKPSKPKLSRTERIAAAIGAMDRALASDDPQKLEHKVAWVLSRYAAARDSDIELQIRFWEHFESADGVVFPLGKAELWRFARLTSLSRVRARIQNTYRRFLATPEVRQRRGKLSEREKQEAVDKAETAPSLQVYADESSKNEGTLVVGSVWVFLASEFLRFFPRLYAWQEEPGVGAEFHFKTIDKKNLASYRKIIPVIAENAGQLGFKSISVANKGFSHVDVALEGLFFQLLRHGVQHEHSSGRCPLPRTLSFTRDEAAGGAEGKDALACAQLRVQLEQMSSTMFDSKLRIGTVEAIESFRAPFVQVADLYAGSIARVLNSSGSKGPKDVFAGEFLEALGLSLHEGRVVSTRDIAHHFSL